MRKWLCSWFAWRFSLTRLTVATVVLGAIVGLNARKIGPRQGHAWGTFYHLGPSSCWGWPLPFRKEFEDSDARWQDLIEYRIPFTHQTYHLLNWDELYLQDLLRTNTNERTFSICAIIDAIFALVVLSLILFLQTPRRKVAARAGE